MQNRCYNPDNVKYHVYGGRGIVVCDRWLDKKVGYQNFLLDMGRRPENCNSIDRIDNDGNYEPSNCRWASQREQMNNTRSNHVLTLNGVSLNIMQWSERVGISDRVLHSRLKRGWSVEKTLTTPKMEKGTWNTRP